MAPFPFGRSGHGRKNQTELGFVLGDAGVNDPGDIVFLVLDFGQKAVIAFFLVIVLDFNILYGDFLIAFHHAHARFRLGFFFLGGLVLILAGGGHNQRRLLDDGFFLFLLGFGLAVLILVLFILGFFGLDHAGSGNRLGLAAATLLVKRLGLKRGTASRAFDGPLRKVVKTRAAAGAAPFCSKISLDQIACSHEEGVVGGARLPRVQPLVKGNKKAAMHPKDPIRLRAGKARPLKGIAVVPGDKSISQRALILGAMAQGETALSGLLESEDVLNTGASLRALGAQLTREGGGHWRVRGMSWKSPGAPLDFGNSGTGSRLVMGAVAGQDLTVVFTGDASLRSRPMARVLEPLKVFGAAYQGQGPKALMPVTLMGAKDAQAIQSNVAVASAQVKSALLLAALNARGTSHIGQATLTRDHTEKMLAAFGANISVAPVGAGELISLEGRTGLKATSVEVPRDPSSAAFPLVAALIVPGSEITLPAILLNPRRTGLIETLLEMGADIRIENRRSSGGEEIGDLAVRYSQLNGVAVPAARAPSMIDEYPILSIAAAVAKGKTVMMGLEELRVKESDRLAAIIAGLTANGVHAFESDNNLTVAGMDRIPGSGRVSTHMDHRIAMSFLTLGMVSESPVTVDDVSMIATSFPEYQDLMRNLGATLEKP